eukprot:CAMPEP_0118951998 /NCGR_PEP_ID=MMETSP1169-20130426/54052_1 /TAXON_ID=36882 /ORGANISM="Pyramimonas obovata, Strain CCMP722" /LENGTH=148 /DNA_ID=CAMNT_0006899157 /DNA_START=168 /DNA_END=610 /DNA_ORIENTATION=-
MSPVDRLVSQLPESIVRRVLDKGSDARVANELHDVLVKDPLFTQYIDQLCSHDIQGVAKNLQDANAAKEKGNRAFAKEKFEDAAVHFTESLSLLDSNDEKNRRTTAILYANRAACLLRMPSGGGPRLASADASRAIRADPSYTKGWVR